MKKLTLTRQTIRRLTGNQLTLIAAGRAATRGNTDCQSEAGSCAPSCTCPTTTEGCGQGQ